MNPLRQIASHISQAFADKTDLNIRISRQKRDLEARKVALVPLNEKGFRAWPGSNPESREINEKLAYAADPTCQQIESEIRRLEDALGLAETALETATNQRRAEEWIIRSRLLEALLGNVVTVQGDLTRVEDTAFDDYADDIADAHLEEKFGENGHFDEPFPPEDDYLAIHFDKSFPPEDGFSPEPPQPAGDEPAFAQTYQHQLAQAVLNVNGNGNGSAIAEEEEIPF